MRAKFAAVSRDNPALIAIVALFMLLAMIYSVTTPVFEAGDEIWHYPFIQHLATGHGLPVQDPAVHVGAMVSDRQVPVGAHVGDRAAAGQDDEQVDQHMVWLHEERIFPLMRRRRDGTGRPGLDRPSAP